MGGAPLLDLVDHVAEPSIDAPLLLPCLARPDVRAPRDVEWRFERHPAHGQLGALEDDGERALREVRTGVAPADRTDHFAFRADAHRDLGEIAARFGDPGETRAEAATALAMYEANENVAAVAQLSGRRGDQRDTAEHGDDAGQARGAEPLP